MARFFLFLLMLPWWLYFPLAGGVVWLGEHVYESALQDEAERKLALAEGPPAPVDAALFDRERDAGAANEVNISGWVNFDYNYELIRKRNGITTGPGLHVWSCSANRTARSRERRAWSS